jgi:hypothetical protein
VLSVTVSVTDWWHHGGLASENLAIRGEDSDSCKALESEDYGKIIGRLSSKSIDKSIAQCIFYQVGSGPHVHFLQHARAICAHGRHAQMQHLGDLGGGHSGAN